MGIFSPQNINATVAATLAQAGSPPDHTKAFILTGEATRDGAAVRAVYVQKVAGGWSLGGEFELASDGTARVGGGVIWTGK